MILVTGGCGFIGKPLCQRLRRMGREVRILDCLTEQVHGPAPDLSWVKESGASLLRGSVCDPAACQASLAGVETVIHLAAETGTGQSMYEMRRYVDTNVTGTAVLLEACGAHPVRKFVLASSRAVYGEGSWRCPACGPVHPALRAPETGRAGSWNPVCPRCGCPTSGLLPTGEGETAMPTSVYGVSKLAQEQLVSLARGTFGLQGTTLRFFNVFGPGQSLSNPYTGVLAVFVNRARTGKGIELYEDGEIVRDFVFVDDVVGAILDATRSDDPGPINIGSGRTFSIGALARFVTARVRSGSILSVTGKMRTGDVRGLVADLGRAERILNWRPSTPTEEGLARFVDWAMTQPFEDRYDDSMEELRARGLYRE
jgi:dTDP-L-rhamnose 4-epimerase